MTDDSGTLRRTALYDAHLALGGRMVPFGGFEMPVQYSSILKEHDAVRKRAGVFDLSHMGQFALTGADVGAWAETLTINKVGNMKPGQARYNVFTNERGGALDDVIFYRLGDERWLLVVNASNADKMWAHVSAERAGDVVPTDLHGERALIAIQGPRSVEWLQPFVDAELAPMKYYSCAEIAVRGTREPVIIARTGYTGEDGFELFVPAEDATALWDALLADASRSAASSRAASARATCCGWKPGCRCTGTRWTKRSRRCKRASCGRSSSTSRRSSARMRSRRNAMPATTPASSAWSWKAACRRAPATPCRRAARPWAKFAAVRSGRRSARTSRRRSSTAGAAAEGTALAVEVRGVAIRPS